MKLNMLGLCLLLIGAQAGAVEFKQVQPSESAVNFAYKQMGVPMEGKFNKFSSQITFDPAKPTVAQAQIEINLASIDTGSTEANDEVAGKLWFNAKTYPTANFVSTGVKALGGNRYEVAGKLTIKGITHEVVAPVSFQTSGTRGVFDGAFTIKRLDYKIGEGEWTEVSTVANEIQIKFHVVVIAPPSKK
jgi:polyisoprenoid-binding protein YceI